MLSKVRLHEDDKGMQNIFPTDGISEAMYDMAAAITNSFEILARNGVVWTDVHSPPRFSLADNAMTHDSD